MMGALALVGALLVAQIQTHPTGLKAVGLSHGRRGVRTVQILDKLREQAGMPSLDLDFARYGDLHDNATGETSLVTFSRSAASSPGTYVGSDGLIKEAAVNEVLYSEQFDQWTNEQTTDSANQIVSPDGKQTADKIIETTSSTRHIVYQTKSGDLSQTRTLSVYAKKAERKYLVLGVSTSGDTNGYAAIFDLDLGAITDTDTNGSATITASISDAGDGWYRCAVSGTLATGTASFFPLIGMSDRDDFSAPLSTNFFPLYTGDGTSGIYLWGAQLEEGTVATPYIKTTSQALAAPRFDHDPVTGESLGLLVEEARSNLFLDSTMVSDVFGTSGAGWTATYTSDSVYSLGRRAKIQTTAARRFNGPSISLSANTSYTISAWVDVVTSDQIIQHFYFRFPPAGASVIWTVDGVSVPSSSTIPAGRHFVTCTMTTSSTVSTVAAVIGSGINSNTTADITFDTPQVEIGAFPTSYIPTAGISLSRAADVAAVQDADFSTTNLLAYSESFDVGWSTGATTPPGLPTVTANQIASPDGQTTGDQIDFPAISTSSQYTLIGQAKTGLSGTYQFSVYLKGASGGETVYLTLASGVPTSSKECVLTTQWQRFTVSGSTSGTLYPNIGIDLRDPTESAQPAQTIYAWGASLTATEYPVAYTTTRNLLTDSQDFERGTWTKSVDVSFGDGFQDPNGTNNAFEITTSSVNHYFRQQLSVVPSTNYVFSFWAKRGTMSDVKHSVYCNSTFANITPTTSYYSSINSSTWTRVSVPFATPAGCSSVTVYILRDSIATGTMYAYGAQLEPGSTATDYVRTVDVVGKAYRWYEPTEGTVFAEYEVDTTTGSRSVVVFSDGSSSVATNEIRAVSTGGGYSGFLVESSGITQVDLFQIASVSANTFLGQVSAFKHNSFAYRTNTGMTLKTDNSGVVPIVNKLFLGYYDVSSVIFSGHIKRLTYWPTRLPDATLQVITQ